VDAVIYCTGYDYAFPFLEHDPLSKIRVEKNSRVRPLYKGTFYIENPSMAFFALQRNIKPLPVAGKTEYKMLAIGNNFI